MGLLLSFRNVSYLPDKEFGITRISFDLYSGKKYHLIAENTETLSTLLGLLEKRLKADSGFIEHTSKLVIQSDRMLLGDKVYSRKVASWLALKEPFTYFEGHRMAKETFMEELHAKSLRHFPIHSLNKKEKIKFALLSMIFQESGIILINQFFHIALSTQENIMFSRFLRGSHCTLCLCSIKNEASEFSQLVPPDIHMQLLDFTKKQDSEEKVVPT